MTDSTGDSLVARARAAVAAGDWTRAYDALTEAQAAGVLEPGDLPLFAEVAYAAGHLDVTIEAWERAHAACVHAGDPEAAAGAAVRVAMHLLFDTALMAPVRGWLARAERLLDGRDAGAAHAWLAVVRAYERLLTGDVVTAREWAGRAVEIGTYADPAAAAVGRVAQARTVILEGDVHAGLQLLDEAGLAIVSSDLDALSAGVVYCELVCALQGLAQYDLAEQWTEAMERWRGAHAIGSLHGRCRVHRAEILRLRGHCVEAEQEALTACVELRPYLRRELGWPLTELARIRLRTGDLDGAASALEAAQDTGWDAQPGLALVQLARDEVDEAAASIRAALEHPSSVPSKELPPNTELRRVPLLEAQVEIEIAAGALDRARAAAAELASIAVRFESKALVAGAELADARVRLAAGDAAEARECFEQAARLWTELRAPYEAALARTGIAQAMHALGDAPGAEIELRQARATLDALGAAHPAGAATDRAPAAARPSLHDTDARAHSVFRRHGEYWSVVFDDLAVQVRDAKGMRYLARLLADPGREFHVLDLVAMERGSDRVVTLAHDPELQRAGPGDDAGEMLDARAKDAYRRRLSEIDEDLEEAARLGDGERTAQATVERDFLVRELSRAVGLSGRDRRAGATSERARASVTRALRNAIARIHSHHPALGAHLERTMRTGTYCAYLPDPRAAVDWSV